MFVIRSAAGAGTVLLLFCISNTRQSPAFNWNELGGPPPESHEPIAFETIPTAEPTPKWCKRIIEHLKRNRPKHPVEMLGIENTTALYQELLQIRANMTKDPKFAWKRVEELIKLKGTTVFQLEDHMKNFTFPDMGIGTYDCSKTDEEFNEKIKNAKLETDFNKLKARFDPYDVINNKSIDWDVPTYDDEIFDQFLKKRIESEERQDLLMQEGVFATEKLTKDERRFAAKWGLPLEERQRNMSLYGTWIYKDNVTLIPDRPWIPVEDLNQTIFDRYATLDLDDPLGFTPILMDRKINYKNTSSYWTGNLLSVEREPIYSG